MKISANSIKEGNILLHNNMLLKVVKQPEHTKPGKGGAYVQVEMKDLKDDKKYSIRFSSDYTVEKAFLEQKEFQYLYTQDNKFIFMGKNSFEQIEVDFHILEEDKRSFLADGLIVKINLHDDKPLEILLPAIISCEIKYTDPIIKGATATASYKKAELVNGLTVKVPQYIATGEKIKIKTEDLSFVERDK